MEDKIVTYCMARLDRAKSLREPFNQDWNDIRDFVRPVTVSFNSSTGQFVTVRQDTMFDGTAPEALEELASALHSYLTNPADRWFELQVDGDYDAMNDPEALEWLDLVSDIIYAQYKREDACLNQALHEVYMDLGSFGTAVLHQEWSSKNRGLSFSARPLQHCYFLEDSEGRVDSVFMVRNWTIRQVKQEFGEVLPPKLMEIKDLDRPVEVMQAVFPRSDRAPGRLDAKNMRYASVWICVTTKETLSESGYESLCYHVPRWTKLSGEIYGRGPAKKCLPDIKMLNAMERTVLKAGQKQVDPPLILANEGFLLPIRTSPGSLIFKEDEDRKIEPLRFEGNLPWAEEKSNQKRQFIEKCFYADWIRMEKENKEMTAYEVADRRDEKLRLLSPMLGRLTSELHGPMIARSYGLLNKYGRIPTAPASMQGKQLKVGYLSPAAVAQLGARANQISRFMNDLIPMAQINPGVFDIVDMDAAAQELAIARRTPRRILRSTDEINQMREEKSKMQAMQQLAQVAEPASKALKNVADAQATAGGGIA